MAPELNNSSNTNQLRNSSNIPQSISGESGGPLSMQSSLPPVPPRQPVQNLAGYSSYRPLNGPLNGFGNGFANGFGNGFGTGFGNGIGFGGNYNMPFSDMSAFNTYGGIGGPIGANGLENRFQQYTAENTRSALHIIETVLNTFVSVTKVIESTYLAVKNFIQTLVNAADSINRLNSTIGQLLSTFALLRLLKTLYKKILYLLGFKINNGIDVANEELWYKSMFKPNIGNEGNNIATYSWTNVALISGLISIGYLLHRIAKHISQIQTQVNNPKSWLKCDSPVYVATVTYDYKATSNEELNLKVGQKVWLAPQSLQSKSPPGWWLATNSQKVGLIPSNYVKITAQLKPRSESENEDEDDYYSMSKETKSMSNDKMFENSWKRNASDS